MSPRKVARALAGVGLFALGAIVLVAVWVVRSRSRERFIKQAVHVLPGSLLHAQNFHWTQMKGEQKQWELRATDASYSEDKTSLKLVGTELWMVLQDGKQLRLRAPKAELKLEGNHVNSAALSGGLEVDYGTMVLTTAEAKYTPDQDHLEAQGDVRILGEGLAVTGVGLDARPRSRIFELRHQVSTQISPRKIREGEAKS
jgi:LPS export ABC transporter protein LptC